MANGFHPEVANVITGLSAEITALIKTLSDGGQLRQNNATGHTSRFSIGNGYPAPGNGSPDWIRGIIPGEIVQRARDRGRIGSSGRDGLPLSHLERSVQCQDVKLERSPEDDRHALDMAGIARRSGAEQIVVELLEAQHPALGLADARGYSHPR